MKKLITLFTGLLLVLTTHASTALVLSEFDSFMPTIYGGSWSAGTAQSGGNSFTIGNFSAGVPKNDGSFTRFFGSAQDFSSYQFVNLTGSAFTGNAANSFAFFVEDGDGNSGLATFDVLDFGKGYASVNLAGLYSNLDPSHVVSWGFTTENQEGDVPFAFTFDQVSLSVSPIPEPSTYAAMVGGVSLFAAMVARNRRRRITA
jgi:hypothetical protein